MGKQSVGSCEATGAPFGARMPCGTLCMVQECSAELLVTWIWRLRSRRAKEAGFSHHHEHHRNRLAVPGDLRDSASVGADRGQTPTRSVERAVRSPASSCIVKDRWRTRDVEVGKVQLLSTQNNIVARGNMEEWTRATRGAAMVDAPEDTRQQEMFSARLGRAFANTALVGRSLGQSRCSWSPSNWRPPKEKPQTKPPRCDTNPRRTAALPHTLVWLDSEELYQLYPMGVAA